MRKLTFIAFLCTLLLVSCNQEEQLDTSSTTNKSGILFKLQKDGYEGSTSRISGKETSPYDELHYFIVDENGEKVKISRAIMKPLRPQFIPKDCTKEITVCWF